MVVIVGKPLCLVCTRENAKYKCPKCRFPYCSLVCYRSHSDEKHADNNPAPKPDALETTPQQSETTTADMLEKIQNFKERMGIEPNTPLDALLDDKQMQDILLADKNDALIQLFSAIDSCPTRAEKDVLFQEAVKHHPRFIKFCDFLKNAETA